MQFGWGRTKEYEWALGLIVPEGARECMPDPIAVVDRMPDGSWSWSVFGDHCTAGNEPSRRLAMHAAETEIHV